MLTSRVPFMAALIKDAPFDHTISRTQGKKPDLRGSGFSMKVEPIGIEPTTSCMPCKRSPN